MGYIKVRCSSSAKDIRADSSEVRIRTLPTSCERKRLHQGSMDWKGAACKQHDDDDDHHHHQHHIITVTITDHYITYLYIYKLRWQKSTVLSNSSSNLSNGAFFVCWSRIICIGSVFFFPQWMNHFLKISASFVGHCSVLQNFIPAGAAWSVYWVLEPPGWWHRGQNMRKSTVELR